jgi:uncharacterized membrane protein YqjE
MNNRPWLQQIARDGKATISDVTESLALRKRLAEAELRYDLALAKRFGIFGGLGLIFLLTSLPVLLTAAAFALDNAYQLGVPNWLVILGSPLAILGAILGYTSWRSFQNRLRLFQETLAQFNEDLQAVQELMEEA